MHHLIFENERCRIFHQQGLSSFLVVTFNELGYAGNVSDFWGRQLLEKLNISAVGVVSKARDWFAGDTLNEVAVATAALRGGYRETIGYGFSMGAYAAIKASKRLAFTSTLAMAPQHSIDPSLVGTFDNRYRPLFKNDLHAGLCIEPADMSGRIWLLSDPAKEDDTGHIQLIIKAASASGATTKMIAVPFAGHDIAVVLAGQTPFLHLLTAMRDDDQIWMQRVARYYARRNPDSHFGRAKFIYSRRRFAAAIDAARRSCDIKDNDAQRHNLLSMLCLTTRLLEEADRHSLRAVALAPRVGFILHQAANVKAALGDLEHALDFARAAHEAAPESQAYRNSFLLLRDRVAKRT